MKRITLALVLVLAVAVMGNVAFADNIQYTTTGVFSSSASNFLATFGNATSTGIAFCQPSSCGGGITVKFNFGKSIPGGYTVPPIAGVSLGSFQVGGFTNQATNVSGNFVLTVHQTSPSVNVGSLSSSISGTFQIFQGIGSVTFTSSSLTLGNIVYSLSNNPIQLNAPDQNTSLLFDNSDAYGDKSTIQAKVDTNPVPEPASLALFGSGLMMGGNFIRRKVMGV